LINAFIQILSIFTIISHAWLLLLLDSINISTACAVNSSILLFSAVRVFNIFRLLKFLNSWNYSTVIGCSSSKLCIIFSFLFVTSWTCNNTKCLLSSNGWWHHIGIGYRFVILNLNIKYLWIRHALRRLSNEENFILSAVRLFSLNPTSISYWRFIGWLVLLYFLFNSDFIMHLLFWNIMTSPLSSKAISLKETLCKLIHLLNDPIDSIVRSLMVYHSIFVNEFSFGFFDFVLFELRWTNLSLRVKGIGALNLCSVAGVSPLILLTAVILSLSIDHS
jgi:hypothetical protein